MRGHDDESEIFIGGVTSGLEKEKPQNGLPSEITASPIGGGDKSYSGLHVLRPEIIPILHTNEVRPSQP
jgi:hypothetical protein